MFAVYGIAACQGDASFVCVSDAQCVADILGVCQSNGYCSFPSSTCPSGLQFGGHSGSLSGQCVELNPSTSTGATSNDSGSGAAEESGISPGTTTAIGGSVGSSPSGEESTTGPGVLDGSSGTSGSGSESGESTGSPLDPDLVLWLEFSTDPQLGVVDSSLSQSEAMCEAASCPVSDVGIFGASARFDGSEDAVVVPHAPQFNTEDGLTVSAWVWLDGPLAMPQTIAAKPVGSANLNSWELWFTGNLTLNFNMHYGGGSNPVGASGPYPIFRWFHVAGLWDGTTETLWYDGVKYGSQEVSGISIDGNPIYVGADDDHEVALDNHFLGQIDDVRIYRRALSDEEIMALVAEGRAGSEGADAG